MLSFKLNSCANQESAQISDSHKWRLFPLLLLTLCRTQCKLSWHVTKDHCALYLLIILCQSIPFNTLQITACKIQLIYILHYVVVWGKKKANKTFSLPERFVQGVFIITKFNLSNNFDILMHNSAFSAATKHAENTEITPYLIINCGLTPQHFF